jgi:hypothetical protein
MAAIWMKEAGGRIPSARLDSPMKQCSLLTHSPAAAVNMHRCWPIIPTVLPQGETLVSCKKCHDSRENHMFSHPPFP